MQREPIAVVGLGAMLPGGSSLEQFWSNLVHKVDLSREAPPGRWVLPPEQAYDPRGSHDHVISQKGFYLDPFELDTTGLLVDPDFLAPLDPLYKVALQASRQAFGDGQTQNLDLSRVGVILAAIALPTDGSSALTWNTYQRHLAARVGAYAGSTLRATCPRNRQVTGLPAGLVARALGLGGGSYTLDAACASSLYAIKLACDELLSGRAEAMLAGGVSRPDSLYTQMGFTALGALSPSGRCSPFDVSGDGLVVGEGAGVLLLKRLSDAERQGDRIYGLICGIGLSNDIGGSLLAPDTEGQLRAMRVAYQEAGWSPDRVQLIECHGTGTPMGDKVEVKSLISLWQGLSYEPGQCAIGSVKSTIGHLLTGAGGAGMIKVLLGMQHQILPPSLNFSQPNPILQLPGSPFRVQQQAEPWKAEHRRAAVSAFGFGGVNAHVLVEEYRPQRKSYPAAAPPEGGAVAIVGMAAQVGGAKNLDAWLQSLFEGGTLIGEAPAGRWNGPAASPGSAPLPQGAYISEYSLEVGAFKIPPKEMPEVLPQQTLMLRVAAQAAADAGLDRRQRRPRAGALIGISLDMDTTNFQLRWSLPEAMRQWGADLSRLEELRDLASKPLDSTRTMGALGSIVASRLAREFNLGGPSFAISAEEASGLKALEVALRALQQNELDLALVTAIDLAGDPRSQQNLPHPAGQPRPFEAEGTGTVCGDGAVALVLKRLADCGPGDKVYAVVRGYGTATGGGVDSPVPSPEAQGLAIFRAHQEAQTQPSQITYVEGFGSGSAGTDQQELAVLQAWYGGGETPCGLGSLTSFQGHTGACSGLLSLVKAAACLSQRRLPPLPHFIRPLADLGQSRLHIPRACSYWLRDQLEGPRRAGVHCLSNEGNAVHVILEEGQPLAPTQLQPQGGLFGIYPGLAAFVEESDESLHRLAQRWAALHQGQRPRAYLVAEDRTALRQSLRHLEALLQGPGQGQGGLYFSSQPLAGEGGVAFIFPGSGNHYAGMGRELALLHPEVMERLDQESPQLRTYLAAPWTVPYRQDWPEGWEQQSSRAIAQDLHRSIFGQVMFGLMASDILHSYGLRPGYAIGYSLGESAALMSMRAWTRRQEIHDRMRDSDLFRRQLGGPCLAARGLWGLSPADRFEWKVAVLNRPAPEVRQRLQGKLELLIVNTDSECVVGGDSPDLARLIEELACQAFYLEGVPTVHSRAVESVQQDYFALHQVTLEPPPGVRFYSAYRGRSYDVTSESAARSIVEQALHGLDFPAVIRQAYIDGARYFVEIGPGNSCTRMISQILQGQRHRALALNVPHRSEWSGLLHLWAALLAEGCPGIGLEALYPEAPPAPAQPVANRVEIRPGALLPPMSRLPQPLPEPQAQTRPEPLPQNRPEPAAVAVAAPAQGDEFERELELDFEPDFDLELDLDLDWEPTMSKQRLRMPALQSQILASAQATREAHEKFLELHQQAISQISQGVAFLQQMGGQATVTQSSAVAAPTSPYYPFCDHNLKPIVPVNKPCVLNYEQCMEFAIGSIARVLGPRFADVDSYPTRVRLPDDPLMLVHRITAIDGEVCSMTRGRVVTEHDVVPGAWYLDNGRMPVCITVEAGQADLFLSGYLGIDLQTKGQRVYRLLDASVSFHRRLPTVGETVVYDIRIDRFVRQGDTWLFFFEFDGSIDGQPMITMRDGCAGFFDYAEIRGSKGIILTEDEEQARPGKVVDYRPLVDFQHKETYSDEQVAALRRGDLAGCFGAAFAHLGLHNPPHLPSGRMKLFDRVLEVDPRGGRFGLGKVLAEADVHPDDWFLTCHFVDDMVMPGTLMYECCAHTLRFLLWRMGWVGEADQVTYEPKLGIPAILRCRGPVDVRTQKVAYEVEIKEVGYGPEPYVLADALMYADGKCIVRFVDMSMRLIGLDRQTLERRWGQAQTPALPPQPEVKVLYDRESIMQFAYGKPSLAFGDKYRVFDEERRIARLPRPPYAFMDRVVEVNQEPWVLQAGGWIEAHYFVPEGEWYFQANRQPTMAFAILLEIALQPCGWLAAYAGSALRSSEDLKFRNLGGTATLFKELDDRAGMLRIRVRMTRVSEAGGMIIENFDMQVLQGDTMVYEGTTYFGFFSKQALDNQVGIRDAKRYQPTAEEAQRGRRVSLPRLHPLNPDDRQLQRGTSACMPAGALQMMDEVDLYVPDGGPQGLGYIHGIKQVNPEEWFFQAHFYMDPVWPGSLGLEAFLQLMKVVMLDRFPQLADTHRFECIAVGREHTWGYRGQVVPSNRKVEVEAWLTRVEEGDEPVVTADGFLVVDGKPIYEMKNFALRMVRV